jgi:NTE family protein
MSERENIRSVAQLLATIETFRDLPREEIAEIEATLKLLSFPRGSVLVRQGDHTNELYLVVSGRFQAYVDNRADAIGEIGPGQSIGEIAFFSGGVRTATVRAARDSLVLRLARGDFNQLAARSPAIWHTIAVTLAQRLSDRTLGSLANRVVRPRTIAVCQAGSTPIPQEFLRNLKSVLAESSRCAVLDSSTFPTAYGHAVPLESAIATNWFNELEARYDHVLYVADATLTSWSEKAIRQADLILSVGVHQRSAPDDGIKPNDIEQFAFGLHNPRLVQLVLLHDQGGAITGTRRWLDARPPISLHHHMVVGRLSDYERLARFINGTALGLVACGGGAYAAAHVGLYQALSEAGLNFDIMGGASGGGAMTAAFALGLGADEIDHRIHDIFIKRNAFGRWTWPRYGLIDHTVLDRALMAHYTQIDIEDLWIPYFAVSTNLSNGELYYHRRGPLWEAVRATSALPGLLSPFYTRKGEMLVDGSLLDNVPVSAMRSIKNGPNVVISFDVRGTKRFDIEYRELPARGQLALHMLNPFSRRPFPAAPGPLSVLVRSLMVGRQDFRAAMEIDDLLLVPPIPSHLSPIDWTRHTMLKDDAYRFGVSELARLKAAGHPLIK